MYKRKGRIVGILKKIKLKDFNSKPITQTPSIIIKRMRQNKYNCAIKLPFNKQDDIHEIYVCQRGTALKLIFLACKQIKSKKEIVKHLKFANEITWKELNIKKYVCTFFNHMIISDLQFLYKEISITPKCKALVVLPIYINKTLSLEIWHCNHNMSDKITISFEQALIFIHKKIPQLQQRIRNLDVNSNLRNRIYRNMKNLSLVKKYYPQF